ncbi:GNAT family N-acetyltransferase [Algoriphagus namhaensis]
MSLEVKKIRAAEDLKAAFAIRERVFVLEQGVNSTDEYDQFEESSTHFLARLEGEAVGTARWRITSNGVKLERFAVAAHARGGGVGQALVEAVLADIRQNPEASGRQLYLHAQLKAVSLYEKFGFEKVGEIFEECNILHYQMELKKDKL